MDITYSASEARARFAEIIRRVRGGKTVTVTYRGEPVAEVRPFQPEPATIDQRLEDLDRRGVLVRSSEPRPPLRAVTRRPGALDRFLVERGGRIDGRGVSAERP